MAFSGVARSETEGRSPIQDYPALCVEIGPEHPLFLFEHAGTNLNDATAYGQAVVEAWRKLPKNLQPFSLMLVVARGGDPASRQQWCRTFLKILQDGATPCVLRIADGDPRTIAPQSQTEDLLQQFTCIKGLQATGISFNEYYEFGADDALGEPLIVRWLDNTLDLSARFGRFFAIECGEINWPRFMANTWCARLREQFRTYANYVVPMVSYRGPHTIPQTSAVMGAWLEGLSKHWGVSAHAQWYTDAHFLEPGVFGNSESTDKMPSSLYRAMILNGAMTGACLYTFSPETDLWFGATPQRWNDAIYPTLRELIDFGFIAPKEQVIKKARIAYQLAPARSPEDFHLNLRDIDGVLDKGFLIHAAYGMERPGQVPELIPNLGRHYWIPMVSATPRDTVAKLYDTVVKAGSMASAQAWTDLLERTPQVDGEGTAFVVNIGRGIFVMNTNENRLEPQTFRIPAVPVAVRQFEARRQTDGIVITWPSHTNDLALAYKVYRKMGPETRFSYLANTGETRQYIDKTADPAQNVAYSIIALTDEKEKFEGTVNYGEYLALSTAESRIAEEAVITPMLAIAQSKPIVTPLPAAPPQPWWPNLTGLTDQQVAIGKTIVKQIEALDLAFTAQDLTGVLRIYSEDYEDGQGWRLPYVRRAYEWFFERYTACAMHRDIRRWDFSTFEKTGVVGVRLYCRFTGCGISDTAGRVADVGAFFPRTKDNEVSLFFSDREGSWRIVKTDPALPNLKDILSFSTSPYRPLPLGPDTSP